jgi:hypothetical protein
VRGQYRGRKPEGQEHVRREIQNTKSEREESEGEKRSPPTLFLLFTDFYYYFDWLKIPFYSFLTFGLKKFFPIFRPMIVI